MQAVVMLGYRKTPESCSMKVKENLQPVKGNGSTKRPLKQ